MSKYILGGGIAGLITAFYNPEHIIITDKIGGQMNDTGLGPRILEVNENSALLLKDLGYDSVPIKTAKIGYRLGDNYIEHVGKDLRDNYYKKSRFLKELKKVPDSVMSDGKKQIRYFDINWQNLIVRLMDRIKTNPILGKVTNIDVKKKIITVDEEEYGYDTLVSTIPAPLFFRLSNLEPTEKLTFVPKTFIIMKEFFDMKNFDYVYFPGDEVDYHRVTKLGHGLVAVEYTTRTESEDILSQWSYALNVKHIPTGQIQSGEVGFIEDIYYIGRYACWDHDLKTDDVVFQALLLNELGDKDEF